jgi:hypothetical protein
MGRFNSAKTFLSWVLKKMYKIFNEEFQRDVLKTASVGKVVVVVVVVVACDGYTSGPSELHFGLRVAFVCRTLCLTLFPFPRVRGQGR